MNRMMLVVTDIISVSMGATVERFLSVGSGSPPVHLGSDQIPSLIVLSLRKLTQTDYSDPMWLRSVRLNIDKKSFDLLTSGARTCDVRAPNPEINVGTFIEYVCQE